MTSIILFAQHPPLPFFAFNILFLACGIDLLKEGLDQVDTSFTSQFFYPQVYFPLTQTWMISDYSPHSIRDRHFLKGLAFSSNGEESAVMPETRVRSLGQEDPLEKGMEIHSGILVWKIPWKEKSARLQSMGSQRVGHNGVTSTQTYYLNVLC